MFGYALTVKEHLTQEETAFLALSYCGLCQELRERFGLPAAMAATYDSLFLVALIAAQRAEPPAPGPATRCPLSGFSDRKLTLADATALRFGGAIALLLAGLKLQDDTRDERRVLEALLLSSNRKRIAAARDTLEQSGFALAKVGALLAAQQQLEREPPDSLVQCLEPAAQIVALIFAHTAAIAENPGNASVLASLGQPVGRIIALADACEDLGRDIRRDAYNPLRSIWRLNPAQPIALTVMHAVCEVLAQQFLEIAHCLQQLQMPRLGRVLNNVLALGLPFRTQISLGRLWHDNHWAGRLPLRMAPRMSVRRCPTCGAPHLWDRTRSLPGCSDRPNLWLLGTIFEHAGQDAQELRFAGPGEYLFANALPAILSAPPAGTAVRGFCNDFARNSVRRTASVQHEEQLGSVLSAGRLP